MIRFRELVISVLWAASLAVLGPARDVSGQHFELSVAPAVLIDPHIHEGARGGPALAAAILRTGGRYLSYGLFLSAGRIDFTSLTLDFHTNHATGALGVRLMTSGTGRAIGVVMGAGAHVADDVNEISPIRSSARWEAMLMPGLEAQLPVGTSVGVTLFARDYVTGVANAVFDPDEADIRHLVILGAGIHFRHD